MDLVLGLYGQSRRFRGYTAETRRNYATDIALLLTFLSQRGRRWTEAVARDLEDFEHWRRFAEANPGRIGGTKWDRELAAFASLYRWAVAKGHVRRNPVAMKEIVSREGDVLTVPAARAKDAKSSNVHWLTPRTWRRWIDIGLRGHTRDGVPEPGWVGRVEDRNVAFVRLLTSSGLRRAEGGSLLTFEVPTSRLDGGRYYRGIVAAEVTRSKKRRTFYMSADAVGEIESYVDSTRALAIRQAQRKGRYDQIPGLRVVTAVTKGRIPVVRWRDQDGVAGERALDKLTVRERMRLFTEGQHGPEPLWLWLNEQGMPFQVHSWEAVFTGANKRCERVLTPPRRVGLDPHQVFAPYATPHSARHSFALYMLVVLETLMDQKYGLSPEERRDFRQLYGDPWFMAQCLLGHASRETTVERYLAPVADLQLPVDVSWSHRARVGADAGVGRGIRPHRTGVRRHPGPGRSSAARLRRCRVDLRGRKASLPPADHARPEYVSLDGLVVHHYNRDGRVKDYDFAALPVAEPMQRSLATLFADRCVPHIWSVHTTSENNWMHLEQFAAFLSQQDHRPEDLDGLTVALVKRWRQASNHRKFTLVAGLLLRDAQLQTGLVADELSRRTARPKSTVQSFSEAEFDQITSVAKRTFRAALSRIEDNARHLHRWREGEFARGSDDWVLGEGLDLLARTGSLLYYKGKEKNGNSFLVAKYRRAFGGANAAMTWQRLFLSRLEAAALGVLLLAQYGWNLSVIDRAEVPRALPDPGEDGHPTYRISLEKLRRGAGHHYETRNVTDDGAGSQGRLITQALLATRFARAIVDDLAPGTDRLIVWRTGRVDDEGTGKDRHPPVGRFRFGVHKHTAQDWAQAEGFAGSPFQRGRRTVIALDRREPSQHSQDTHDRQYVLVDKRVRQEAVEVIAEGAEDAAARARHVVLVAELRDQRTPGDVETATADCGDFDNSPWPAPDGGCGASFLACLGCPNARVHPGHHARLVHLHEALTNLRSVLPPDTWEVDWGDPHARLTDLKAKLGAGQWTHALDRVTDDDRTLINDLLTGALDT